MSHSDQLRALATELTSQASILPSYVESVSARLITIAADMDRPPVAEAVEVPAEADKTDPPAGTPLTPEELSALRDAATKSIELATTVMPSTAPHVEVPAPSAPQSESFVQHVADELKHLGEEIGIHEQPA